jgi:HEAT repeat protein
VRGALLVSLRYDKDAGVRLKALEGLQQYVSQDQRVRDAVLEALLRDPDANVRRATIDLLVPVKHDSSVRQVLRQVSTQDENPYIRTVSYNALQGADSIQ